jgi:hypothetical protein
MSVSVGLGLTLSLTLLTTCIGVGSEDWSPRRCFQQGDVFNTLSAQDRQRA